MSIGSCGVSLMGVASGRNIIGRLRSTGGAAQLSVLANRCKCLRELETVKLAQLHFYSLPHWAHKLSRVRIEGELMQKPG